VSITQVNPNVTINVFGNTINGYFSQTFNDDLYYRNKDNTFNNVNSFSQINTNTISELIYYRADTTTDITYNYVATANGQTKNYQIVVTNNWTNGRSQLLRFVNITNYLENTRSWKNTTGNTLSWKNNSGINLNWTSN
jgi:hypothetical protein